MLAWLGRPLGMYAIDTCGNRLKSYRFCDLLFIYQTEWSEFTEVEEAFSLPHARRVPGAGAAVLCPLR